jgi:hypothetical protein
VLGSTKMKHSYVASGKTPRPEHRAPRAPRPEVPIPQPPQPEIPREPDPGLPPPDPEPLPFPVPGPADPGSPRPVLSRVTRLRRAAQQRHTALAPCTSPPTTIWVYGELERVRFHNNVGYFLTSRGSSSL